MTDAVPTCAPCATSRAPRTQNPRNAGLSRMRRRGLEPPRGNPPTRPSTLRVYQFRHRRRGGRSIARLLPSGRPRYLVEHMFGLSDQPDSRQGAATVDLTKRQQEIFDFIKRYSAELRLSAHRARHRQGRRPRLVVDGARAPREPREARAAAARSVQAARDRAARPRRRAGQVDRRRPDGPAARRPGRRRLAGARRGEHRGVRRGPARRRAARRASTSCASAASR